MRTTLETSIKALALHPTIEALLLEAGCHTVANLVTLPIPTLMDCGLSFKELAEIVELIDAEVVPSGRND
ncbi:MAG: hypothetical protein JRH20_18480 [Deltaproteobacteria bacterium]|nr:hypothetical protein [Deltaproteobacteria bacterium]